MILRFGGTPAATMDMAAATRVNLCPVSTPVTTVDIVAAGVTGCPVTTLPTTWDTAVVPSYGQMNLKLTSKTVESSPSPDYVYFDPGFNPPQDLRFGDRHSDYSIEGLLQEPPKRFL